MNYIDSMESVEAADLEGFLAHWDFTPPAGTLLRMLKGSSVFSWLVSQTHQRFAAISPH